MGADDVHVLYFGVTYARITERACMTRSAGSCSPPDIAADITSTAAEDARSKVPSTVFLGTSWGADYLALVIQILQNCIDPL